MCCRGLIELQGALAYEFFYQWMLACVRVDGRFTTRVKGRAFCNLTARSNYSLAGAAFHQPTCTQPLHPASSQPLANKKYLPISSSLETARESMSTSEQLSSAPAAAAATSTSASTTTSTSSSSTTPINPLTGNLHNTLLSVTSTGASTAPGAPTTQLTIQIQNLTTTLNLHCPLDLRRISSTIMNTEYAPSKFGACIMRLMNPKCTCLLFASGKCVITGSRR